MLQQLLHRDLPLQHEGDYKGLLLAFRFPNEGNKSLVTEPFNYKDEYYFVFDPVIDSGLISQANRPGNGQLLFQES